MEVVGVEVSVEVVVAVAARHLPAAGDTPPRMRKPRRRMKNHDGTQCEEEGGDGARLGDAP